MSKKIPETSLEAYRSLNPVKVSETQGKIAAAVQSLGRGNYELIAAYLNEPEGKIWKRIGECVKLGLIHKTGETKQTKNGCKSYLYFPGPSSEPIKKKERVMKGKTVADYSRSIQQVHPILQQSLF